MRPDSRRRKSDYIRPAVSEARANRLWMTVLEAEAGSPARARRWVAVAAVALAALVLLIARPSPWKKAPPPSLRGLIADTDDRSQQLTLPDGSTVLLSASTRVSVVDATPQVVRLRLEHGKITCEVPPRGGRRFVVDAGEAEVEVKGTRFTVEAGQQPGSRELAVHVDRGVVEVRAQGGAAPVQLRPGESWVRDAELPPAPSAAPSPAPTPAPASAESPPLPPPAAPAASGDGARALFERADSARVSGRLSEAAAAFDQLRRRYPKDARAGVAAFEAGRLRLGSLGDPRGAVDAFSFAIAHSEGSFREDAEAGRVEALAQAGDRGACKKSQGEFLQRYPRSVHASRVEKLCP